MSSIFSSHLNPRVWWAATRFDEVFAEVLEGQIYNPELKNHRTATLKWKTSRSLSMSRESRTDLASITFAVSLSSRLHSSSARNKFSFSSRLNNIDLQPANLLAWGWYARQEVARGPRSFKILSTCRDLFSFLIHTRSWSINLETKFQVYDFFSSQTIMSKLLMIPIGQRRCLHWESVHSRDHKPRPDKQSTGEKCWF